MTLPAHQGQISYNQVNTELGHSATAQLAASNIYAHGNATFGIQYYNLDAIHGYVYYAVTASTGYGMTSTTTTTYCSYANSGFQDNQSGFDGGGGFTNCYPRFAYGSNQCGYNPGTFLCPNCNCVCNCNYCNCNYNNCNCNCDCSCFPAGTRVLMEDGTEMAIENVKVGMRVRGATCVNMVVELEYPVLGQRKLMAMNDGSLLWSEEHPLWVRRDGKQWWWTAGYAEWLREVENGTIKGLRDNDSIYKWSGGEEEFAHVTGWVKRKPVVIEGELASPDLQFYFLILDDDGDKTFFANSYVTSGGTDGFAVDYTKIDWK